MDQDIEEARQAGNEQGRTEAIRDAISDLEDFLRDAPAGEIEGMRAAIEILRANHPH